jgi:hypothetical protein
MFSKQSRQILAILVSLVLFSAGCNFSTQTSTPFPAAEYTAAAQTLVMELTQNAPGQTPTSSIVETAIPPTEIPPATATFPEISPTQTPLPTGTSTPTASITPMLAPTNSFIKVFEDDFSSEEGWYTEEGDEFGFKFVDDGYMIYVNFTNGAVVSYRERDYADVSLEADIARNSGPSDSYYGLTCRLQDLTNYYSLVISPDGSFAIIRMLDGKLKYILEGTAPAGVIRSGNETNRVRADCIGQTLTIFANGQKLGEIQDDNFSSGYVGLTAGNRMQTGIEAVFHFFAIYTP